MTALQPLGAIVKTTKGKKPRTLHDAPAAGLVPYIDISAVEHGTQRQWADPREAKVAPSGSLVMVWDGARSGWVGITRFEGALGSTLAALESPLNSRFLAAYLRSRFADINSNHRGSGIPHVNPDYLWALEVPVFSDDAQLAIADLTEAAAKKADSSREHLAVARRRVESFRQSVLAAGSLGRLTSDWRAARGAVDQERPSGWRTMQFREACEYITVGHVGKMVSEYRESGIPFLRSLNVRELRFDPQNLKYISPEFHARLRKSALRPGDIVIVRSGFVGTACVIPPDLPHANCSDLVIARPGPTLRARFGAIVVNSPHMKAHVAEVKVGSAQAHFNTRSMQAAPLQLPPLEEQDEIIRRVDELLALADELVRRIDRAATHVARSSQAVLAKAFRGELSTNGT